MVEKYRVTGTGDIFDVEAIVSFESFRALKLTLFETFRVLKYYNI